MIIITVLTIIITEVKILQKFKEWGEKGEIR